MALLALFTYFTLVFFVGYFSIKKHMSSQDFIIGNRSLNFWLTALAAHASDMSSWLFLAYPAALYLSGFVQVFTALGLVLFMWLNWMLVAKPLRVQTEHLESQTLSTFFEKKLIDPKGYLRLFTALMSFIFYTIYIASGVYGIGFLTEYLFNIPFAIGCILGLLIIVPYVFFGGFISLAWIDLFQGLFLLTVICLVPIYYFITTPTIELNFHMREKLSSGWLLFFGWGLGYFGQPHIVTKFMGIKNPESIKKSRLIGMSWMILSLSAATLVGLMGSFLYKDSLQDPQTLFLRLVTGAFTPYLAYFMLCAVIAATINATSSQLLVLASSITEDIYHKFFNQKAHSKTLLKVSRISVVVVGILSFLVAFFKVSSIYGLVLYAWSGLGASFGPLILYCLYSRKPKLAVGWAGLLSGSLSALIWPAIPFLKKVTAESLLPSFILSFVTMAITSWIVSFQKKQS